MPIMLNCRDLGADCDHFVNGETIDAIVVAMQQHAISVHGYPEAQVMSDDMRLTMRHAIKQTSRPAGQRTARLPFE